MNVKDHEPKIALFIDFDNLAIGLKETGGQIFEINLILYRLLEKGKIIYKRAYADWYIFSDAKQALHDAGIEMVDIPMRRHIGKNSADIRMVVDALDLCYTKEHIDTFAIGSGDSDFSPLVSKLKENDKHVIGFGLRGSTSNLLADNCDEFIYYEDLTSIPMNRPPLPAGLTVKQSEAFTILLDAVAALMRENKEILWSSLIKDAIRRKRPAFSESQYGYSSFSQLLEDATHHGLIGLIKDPKSGGTPVVTGFGSFTAKRSTGSRIVRPQETSFNARSTQSLKDQRGRLATTSPDESVLEKSSDKEVRKTPKPPRSNASLRRKQIANLNKTGDSQPKKTVKSRQTSLSDNLEKKIESKATNGSLKESPRNKQEASVVSESESSAKGRSSSLIKKTRLTGQRKNRLDSDERPKRPVRRKVSDRVPENDNVETIEKSSYNADQVSPEGKSPDSASSRPDSENTDQAPVSQETEKKERHFFRPVGRIRKR